MINIKETAMANGFSMYVLTDTHFLSPAMWEEGESINNREMGDQIAIKDTPAILRSFFKKIIADEEAKYVLITGDLINNGDKRSHLDFMEQLKALTDAGKTVFVTCATHDYAGEGEDENIFHAVYYTKDGCIPAERVYKTELPSLYYDYGHKYADSIDGESGSYAVNLSEKIRMIAIYDNGNGRSHCGLFDEGFNWLTNEIRSANERGQTVFLAVHHPVIPPWPVYKDIAEFELFGGYERLRKIMCENGVRMIFTGHTHVHGIKKYTDDEGRWFYDITTNALPSAEGKMRKLVFDTDGMTCTVTSVGIENIEGIEGSAREHIYYLNFAGLFEKSLPLMKKDWDKFLDVMSHIANPSVLRKHPHISRAVISAFLRMKMSFPAKIGRKQGGLTKEEIKGLKNVSAAETAFNVLAHVFPGNAPYTPDTPEYKAVTGMIKRISEILSRFGVDIDKLIPGEETVLETVNHFMYNTRTGDDNSVVVDLRK